MALFTAYFDITTLGIMLFKCQILGFSLIVAFPVWSVALKFKYQILGFSLLALKKIDFKNEDV